MQIVLHSTQPLELSEASLVKDQDPRFRNKTEAQFTIAVLHMGHRHGQCLDVKKPVLVHIQVGVGRQTFRSDSVQCSGRPTDQRPIVKSSSRRLSLILYRCHLSHLLSRFPPSPALLVS